MTGHSYPLDRPLPPDVAAGESPFIQFYQKYAVFSWAWAWRRTFLFGSIGALAGISFGATHGLAVQDFREAVAVGMACAAANIILVGAGPLLASFFRHRNWPRRVERTSIVTVVILGCILGSLSGEWAAHFHDGLMVAHGAQPADPEMPVTDLHMIGRRILDVGRDLLILFTASGGLALPAYFSEKKRWAEHWRRVELEKISLQKIEADAKLTLLQAQIEPHFLFNTLASVRSLVTTDPQRAAQTIDALALHLRATLPKLRAETGTPQSTLGEQFAICGSYLELMKVRIGERLRIAVHLPPELREAPFPPLLLISLVENAIKHGVEPKPGVVHVTLDARALDGEPRRMEISVADDGAGLTLGMGEGTGLANLRAQLLIRFGSAASFDLSQREPGGVRARLVIPLESLGP